MEDITNRSVFLAERRCALLLVFTTALPAASISHMKMKFVCHLWMRVFMEGPFMSNTLCWREVQKKCFILGFIFLVWKVIPTPGRTVSKVQIKVSVIKRTQMITFHAGKSWVALILSEVGQSEGTSFSVVVKLEKPVSFVNFKPEPRYRFQPTFKISILENI